MEGRATQIVFADGNIEELLVTPVGPNLYRLEESSALGEIKFHDVIETEMEANGSFRFVRLISRSELETVTCVIPENQFESPRVSAFLRKVIDLGGYWEKMFGGIVVFHLPAATKSATVKEFETLFQDVDK